MARLVAVQLSLSLRLLLLHSTRVVWGGVVSWLGVKRYELLTTIVPQPDEPLRCHSLTTHELNEIHQPFSGSFFCHRRR